MNPFIDFLSHESCTNLALALLHSLWQGTIIGMVLFALLKTLPARVSRLRYGASLLAQFSMVFVCLVTWSFLNYQPFAESNATQVESANLGNSIHQVLSAPKVLIEPSEEASATSYTYLESSSLPWTVWILVIWLIGVIIMLARMSVTIANVNAIRLQCRPVKDQAILGLVEQISKSFHLLRPLKVLLSDSLQSPAVMGIIWPVILLPVSMVSGLSPDALRAILAHEMAHIQRWDYLVNLAQMLIEALLFFNPFVWWINRQIRLEREACCDTQAINVTGDRKQYINALTQVIEQFRAASPKLQPASSFSHEAKPGDMLDRVKRIVHPERRPRLWTPWPGFIAFLLISALIIACMQKGADYFVESASEWMITEEQVEQIVEIEKTHNIKYSPNDNRRPKVKISGTMRTWDGSPLPKEIRAYYDYATRGIQSFKIVEGQFSFESPYGNIYLFTNTKDYATSAAGPFIANASCELEDIELVLKPKFEGRIQFVESDNNPIPAMTLESLTSWRHGHGAYHIGAKEKYQGDKNGIVKILASSDLPETIYTKTPGYQHDFRVVQLIPDKIYSWELIPANVTTGIVVSKNTGKPIPHAEIRKWAYNGTIYNDITSSNDGYQKINTNYLSTHTDEKGEFVLNKLRDNTVYAYVALAPNEGKAPLSGLRSGQKNLRIEIGDPIIVKGKIIGLDEKPDSKNHINYHQYYTINQNGRQTNNSSMLSFKDGVGHFETGYLWSGKLTISVGKRKFDYIIKESIDDLVIDLSKPDVSNLFINNATWPVTIDFDIPPDAAPPKGSLTINYLFLDKSKSTPQKRKYQNQVKTYEIVDGKIIIDIPVPATLDIWNKELIGYWFQDGSHFEIDESDKPKSITLPLIPAGSVYGQIKNNNNLVDELHISVIELKESPFLEEIQQNLNLNYHKKTTNKFAIHPLPFGGVYAVVLYNKRNVLTSKPFAVTSSNPTVEWNPVVPEGITINGQVLKPDGSPLPDAELGLFFVTDYSKDARRLFHLQNYFNNYPRSDSKGKFKLSSINPDVKGHYLLAYLGNKNYQVAQKKLPLNGEELTLHLKRGLKTKGVVLYADSGLPAPGVTMTAYPYDARGKQRNKHPIAKSEKQTNSKGEFQFSNLEPIEYSLSHSLTNMYYIKNLIFVGGQVDSVTVWLKPN